MSNLSGSKKVALLFLVLIVPSIAYMLMTRGVHHFTKLPVYGEKELSSGGDTLFHTIPDFSFTNQDGKNITQEYYKDKIYVADFFFTTCPSICPKMSSSLGKIQEKFKAQRDVKLVSFTVNPENDSVEVLKDYAKKFMVNSSKWNLLTGSKMEIYELGVKGYLVPASEDALAPGGFLHSEYLMLIDKEKRIRGFYDGTNEAAVDSLIGEIIVLMQEYRK